MNTIRCSSLPRIMACPASLITPQVAMNSSGDVADIGTAVHEVLSEVVANGYDAIPELSAYAKKYDLDDADRKDLTFLAYRGLNIWNIFKAALDPETISCESHLSRMITKDWLLSGHIDMSGRLSGQDTYVIIDWKSGYVERQHAPQLLGYAYLLHHHASPYRLCTMAPLSFKIVTAWLRSGAWDVLDVTEDDLEDFRKRVVEVINSPDKTYAPDDGNCMYCPRSSECPAKAQLVQSAADTFYPLQENSSAALSTREQLAAVYDQSLLLGRALENYRKALKTTVASDGPISLPDGRVLSLAEKKTESVLFGPETLDVVAPYLALQEVSHQSFMDEVGREAITVRKKDLTDAVSRHAERGNKSAAIKAVMADLAEAECIKTSVFETLEITKTIAVKEK